MRSLAELKSFTREAARILARENDLASYEIYCATAEHRIARLSYTSDIPSRGLEEFKSLHADGFQLRVAMRRDPHEVGAAFEAGDFTADSVRDALRRARSAAVVDPHFPGFPAVPLEPQACAVRKKRPGESRGRRDRRRRVGRARRRARCIREARRDTSRSETSRSDHRWRRVGDSRSNRDLQFEFRRSSHRRERALQRFRHVDNRIARRQGHCDRARRFHRCDAPRRPRAWPRRRPPRACSLSRRAARGGKISRRAGTAADRRDSQLHGDGLAHDRRVSRRQFRVSRKIRRAGDGFTPEPRRRPGLARGRDSPSNHLRRNPNAPCRIDPRRQARRLALEFLRHPSPPHRRASRRKARRQRSREARLSSAERLPARRRRRPALRRESRLGGHQRRDACARRSQRPRTGARRRRRNLRRPHLVHLSNQRPARGRFHLHRHRRLLH